MKTIHDEVNKILDEQGESELPLYQVRLRRERVYFIQAKDEQEALIEILSNQDKLSPDMVRLAAEVVILDEDEEEDNGEG